MNLTIARAQSPEDFDAVRDLVRAYVAWAMAALRKSGGTKEIKPMFVRPEAWGKGVGRAMLDALLAEAQAAGHRRYILSPRPKLHAPPALYAPAEFERVPPTGEFPGVTPDFDVCLAMTPDATAEAAL